MRENHTYVWFLMTFISLFSFNCHIMGQEDFFEYEDDGQTIITRLTEYGQAQTSLTIPSSITKVCARAFAANDVLTFLKIEGAPVFEEEENGTTYTAFKGIKKTLREIDMGSAMSLDQIKAILLSYGKEDSNASPLTNVIIQGYHDGNGTTNGPVSWGEDEDDQDINAVLTSNVRVILPVEIIGNDKSGYNQFFGNDESGYNQFFGNAQVYGRFNKTSEVSTFCGKATFKDDGNSNWLFYVPCKNNQGEYTNSNQVFFERVLTIKEYKGVLICRREGSAYYADLLRIDDTDNAYDDNDTEYNDNMLVGVTTPTEISPTDGAYTNMILSQGKFYPTSGGTLKANRAYLQVETTVLQSGNLSIVFEDESADAINDVQVNSRQSENDAWYTLDGRQFRVRPTLPGIYLNKGKAIVVK